jgi:hypothetical protein
MKRYNKINILKTIFPENFICSLHACVKNKINLRGIKNLIIDLEKIQSSEFETKLDSYKLLLEEKAIVEQEQMAEEGVDVDHHRVRFYKKIFEEPMTPVSYSSPMAEYSVPQIECNPVISHDPKSMCDERRELFSEWAKSN